jgi:hypothetical protein
MGNTFGACGLPPGTTAGVSKMSNEKQSQTSNEKRSQQQDEQDMNKKMAKSQDQGLHTKQEGEPDENDSGVGAGTVSTGGSSDGTGSA